MREKTVCFTGHRYIPTFELISLHIKLKKNILKLIDEGYCYFGTGGALGFDTFVAQKILSLKHKYPHIKLILVLPCISQTKYWSKREKGIRIINIAD